MFLHLQHAGCHAVHQPCHGLAGLPGLCDAPTLTPIPTIPTIPTTTIARDAFPMPAAATAGAQVLGGLCACGVLALTFRISQQTECTGVQLQCCLRILCERGAPSRAYWFFCSRAYGFGSVTSVGVGGW